ncbi:MAG: hypothetical protein ACLPN5_10685 [Roseiarcus sp.]
MAIGSSPDAPDCISIEIQSQISVLCSQIWLYGIWVSSLETFLFDRANPVWFLFLFAVFTLRYLATFRSAP